MYLVLILSILEKQFPESMFWYFVHSLLTSILSNPRCEFPSFWCKWTGAGCTNFITNFYSLQACFEMADRCVHLCELKVYNRVIWYLYYLDLHTHHLLLLWSCTWTVYIEMFTNKDFSAIWGTSYLVKQASGGLFNTGLQTGLIGQVCI